MVKIIWTSKSFNDLESIFEYIAKDSKKYASIQVRMIKDRTKQIKLNPLSGRVVPEFNDVNLRELIEGNYRIAYLIKSENVFI
jgi:addiction module RelE/StbE family toxin